MAKEFVEKICRAIEETRLVNYDFINDTGYTHFYNDGAHNVTKWDEDYNIYTIRRDPTPSVQQFGNGPVKICAADPDHVCEFRTGGTAKEVKKFIEALGIELTNEENKILLSIEANNTQLIPATGDYFNFKELSQEEFDELTPEEQEKYLKEKDDYDRQHIPNAHVVAQITV